MLAETFDIGSAVVNITTMVGVCGLMVALGAWRRGVKADTDTLSDKCATLDADATKAAEARKDLRDKLHDLELRLVSK